MRLKRFGTSLKNDCAPATIAKCGNVNIIGSTSISGNSTYAIKFGDHASETSLYDGGSLTLDTTGDITGKIILMKEDGFVEKNVGAGSIIEYHFGKNKCSTYVDGMATDGEGNQLFAARVGDLSATGGEDLDDGILYKDLATAEAATDLANWSAATATATIADGIATIKITPPEETDKAFMKVEIK